MLISSHLLAEVQQTVDRVVVLARGRLVHSGTLAELAGPRGTVVRAPDRTGLHRALTDAGLEAHESADGLLVAGHPPAEVGAIAFRAGVELHELRESGADLEQTFLRLTSWEPPTGEPVENAPALPGVG